MKRRLFLQTLALSACAVSSSRPVWAADPTRTDDKNTNWYNFEKLPLEGRAWDGEERNSPYDRFPKRWMERVPGGVAGNSRHSSGMAVHVKTNSPTLKIKYELTSASLGMWHMQPSGVSGFDLYMRAESGEFRYVRVVQADASAEADFGGLGAPGEHELLIYLPLYNGVKLLEIGVPSGSSFEIVQRKEKPLLFYGTSIVHGACATRPGMPHPAILGRRLNLPFWNFGFSGCGRMELVMAEAFGELDPSVYVIDCLPNMNPELVTANAYPFLKKLRELRPETPILLLEDRAAPRAWMDAGSANFHRSNHAALRAQYDRLISENVSGITYMAGDGLLPPDGDGTVDNSHSTDYGFWYQANVMEPVLREILGMAPSV